MATRKDGEFELLNTKQWVIIFCPLSFLKSSSLTDFVDGSLQAGDELTHRIFECQQCESGVEIAYALCTRLLGPSSASIIR
jgi:hypothetical protein